MKVVATGAYGALATGDVEKTGRRAPWIEVATDRTAFSRIWARTIGLAEAPEVDFESRIAVLLLLPLQRTGGYAIEPHRARGVEGDVLEIDATLIEPTEGAMTTQALTSPFAVIEVERFRFQRIDWLSEGRLVARKEIDWTN